VSADNGGEDGQAPAKRRKPRKTRKEREATGSAVVRAEPVGAPPELEDNTPQLITTPRDPNPYPLEEQLERALRWLAQGRTLRQLCRLDPRMPASSDHLREKFAASEELWGQYARARDRGLDAMAEELLDVADDGRNDWMELERRGKVERVVDREAVARSQLRVDTRKWYLSKLAPKRYGDRLDVTSGGEKIAPQSLVLGDVVVVF
jgi:hypothetical protein